jgi:threonine synthase
MYYVNRFPPAFGITPRPELSNRRTDHRPEEKERLSAQDYTEKAALAVASGWG